MGSKGSHRTCEICGVKERHKHCSGSLLFAAIPLNVDRCREWLRIIGNGELVHLPIEKLHTQRHVCGNHFQKKDFNKKGNRLKKHAIPSLNLTAVPLSDDELLEFPQHEWKETAVSLPEELPSTSKCTSVTVVAEQLLNAPLPEELPSTSRCMYVDDTPGQLLNVPSLEGLPLSSKCTHVDVAAEQTEQPLNGYSGQVVTTEVSSLVMPGLDVSSASNRIQADFNVEIDEDDAMQDLYINNMSSTSIDNELSSKPESSIDNELSSEPAISRAIIARVYHYLQKEYECLKTMVGGSCDVSPFADILRRTAEATGVTENTVTSVLQESKCAEQLDDLDNNTSRQESPMDLNCETYNIGDTSKMDTALGDDVYILDLREKDAVNAENESKQCTLKKNSQLPSKLIKSHFVARSELKESDGTNSEILRKLQCCRWCSVRKRGYNKNLWMCKQCKVSLCLNKCFRNCCRVP